MSQSVVVCRWTCTCWTKCSKDEWICSCFSSFCHLLCILTRIYGLISLVFCLSPHHCRNMTKSGERRSRLRSSAGTTVSGWRWWRTVKWMKQESPSCSGRTENPSSGTETSWRDLTCSTALVLRALKERFLVLENRLICQRVYLVCFTCTCISTCVCIVSSRWDHLSRRCHQSWVLHRLPEWRAGTDWIPEQVWSSSFT